MLAKGNSAILKFKICWSCKIRASSSTTFKIRYFSFENPAKQNIPNLVHPNHFKDISKQRELFDKIAKNLNIKNWEEWYYITTRDMIYGGAR
jgi:hypothetical protein